MLAFRRVVSGHVNLLDPFSLIGFMGSWRVTCENSRVYPLDPFIKQVVFEFKLNGSNHGSVLPALHIGDHFFFLNETSKKQNYNNFFFLLELGGTMASAIPPRLCLLVDLGVDDDDRVVVTLVPRYGN